MLVRVTGVLGGDILVLPGRTQNIPFFRHGIFFGSQQQLFVSHPARRRRGEGEKCGHFYGCQGTGEHESKREHVAAAFRAVVYC